jgi:uridine kinase
LTAIVIGICGGTGSGKTTLTSRITQAFSERTVLVVEQDHYYKDLSHLPAEERARQNFDHPNSIDMSLMIDHLRQLRLGQAIDRPVYNFVHHRREKLLQRLDSRPVLIVEGILIFENKALRDLMDIKIFVDADADLRFIRRLLRDLRERGRTVESVVEQYLTTARLMHLQFIEPSKHYADVIFPAGAHNSVGIDLVIQKIRSLISTTDQVSAHSYPQT